MVAGWIKKIAINKGKEYVKNWVKEHIVLVVSVVILLFIILIFAMKGIFFDPFRRRRRNYLRFKKYILSKEGISFIEEAKMNVDKKLEKKARKSARTRAGKEIRSTMQRMHGAGVCHGLFPNPREWLESYRCWRRLRKEWDREAYRTFPAAVRWFPGDLDLPFARGILRGKAEAEIERKFEPIMEAVDTLEKN